jgi:large exoprotein involved in heme utilization and adhesion
MTPPTALVDTVNVPLVDADGTVTLAGTVTGSPLDKAIATPPAGAALLMTTVPVTESPPTTVDALSVNAITLSAGPAATVTIGDWRVTPLSDAAMMAVPAATPVTVIVALDSPAAIIAGVCTTATPELLLDNATVAPPAGAGDVNVTVPLDVLPAARFVETSVTLAIPVPVDGPAGELELLQ